MSAQHHFCISNPYRSAVGVAPAELFPAQVEDVFNHLESLAKDDQLYEAGEAKPTPENIDWAKRVLLRIIPRYYLVGAEIDAFRGEIHVSWENGNKRVVAFLPAPDQLKLYYERTKENGEVEHDLRPGNDPWMINAVLKWLYA
jgi:hypothetical protein